jgi:hypothetical protein
VLGRDTSALAADCSFGHAIDGSSMAIALDMIVFDRGDGKLNICFI